LSSYQPEKTITSPSLSLSSVEAVNHTDRSFSSDFTSQAKNFFSTLFSFSDYRINGTPAIYNLGGFTARVAWVKQSI
jgi:hypothetical protein